jgi:hypothetical protein
MVATSPVVNGTPHSSEEPKPKKVRRSGSWEQNFNVFNREHF